MADTAKMPRKRDGDRPARRPLVHEELADQLLDRAQGQGAELLGPDGLLSQGPGLDPGVRAPLGGALRDRGGGPGPGQRLDRGLPHQAAALRAGHDAASRL